MTQYQSTPDYYRDYIEHGWLKDAVKAGHKYIERWRNAAGKWVYRYKKPESKPSLEGEMASKMLKHPGSNYMKAHSNWARDEKNKRWSDVGRARLNAKFKSRKSSMTGRTGSRVNQGTVAGRKRTGIDNQTHVTTIKKGNDIVMRINRKGPQSNSKGTTKVKVPKKGNLTSRGYSGSKGSGESKRQSNMGTRHSTRSLNNATGSRDGYRILYSKRAKDYSEYRKNPQRYTAKDAIEDKRILGSSDKYVSNKPYSRATSTAYNKDHDKYRQRQKAYRWSRAVNLWNQEQVERNRRKKSTHKQHRYS